MKRNNKPVWKIIILVVGSLIALTAIGMYIFSIIFIKSTFSQRVVKLENNPDELRLTEETISLTSNDGIDLQGWWIPNNEPKGVVVVLHGMDGLIRPHQVPDKR